MSRLGANWRGYCTAYYPPDEFVSEEIVFARLTSRIVVDYASTGRSWRLKARSHQDEFGRLSMSFIHRGRCIPCHEMAWSNVLSRGNRSFPNPWLTSRMPQD
jgi:hypothetical protein